MDVLKDIFWKKFINLFFVTKKNYILYKTVLFSVSFLKIDKIGFSSGEFRLNLFIFDFVWIFQ